MRMQQEITVPLLGQKRKRPQVKRQRQVIRPKRQIHKVLRQVRYRKRPVCSARQPEINQLLPKSALQLLETTLMHLEALALRQAATQQLPVQQVRQLGIIRPHLREQVLQPEITQMLAAFTVPRQETKHRLQMIGAQQLALRLKHMGVEARLPDIRQLPLHPTVRLSARHQTQAG